MNSAMLSPRRKGREEKGKEDREDALTQAQAKQASLKLSFVLPTFLNYARCGLGSVPTKTQVKGKLEV